jgi:predicted Zn-dependent peptidase
MPLKFEYQQLANGLDIVAEHNADSHTFAAGLYVKTGSRDEEPRLCGVSHFLEHMMFKGSESRGWEAMNRIFDELGARYNAFTTQEMTAYYANVLPEFTGRTLEHLGHLLRPAIRPEDFETEKKVILEEIAMYMDEPSQRLYEKVMAEHFGDHPLGLSVLGTSETVSALQREEMARYFAARYGPGNMVLAVAGRFDFAEIVHLAEKHYGRWPRVHAPRRHTQPRYRAHRVDLSDARLNRAYSMAMMPGPSAQDERRFAARVLADIIGDSEGSRFYWALVDNAIADEADFNFYPHDGCGSFYFSLVTDPERAEPALDIARRELARVKEDLTADEVDRAKTKIATSIVLSGELPLGRVNALGAQWLYNGDYRSLEQDLQTLLAITPDSLQALLRDFPFDPMTIVTLGPRA